MDLPGRRSRKWYMKGVKDFHDLKVWQKAHQLTLAVYQLTSSFPREELYGLTTQIRRSSSSIAANLAEGCSRNVMLSWPGSARSPWGRPASCNPTCCWPVTRMLAALLRKLNADR